MKRYITLLLCLAACVSCGRRIYNIDAVYTAPDGTDVYLIDIAGNDTLAVTTVKDNAFSFTGQADEGVFAYVGHGNDRETTASTSSSSPGPSRRTSTRGPPAPR